MDSLTPQVRMVLLWVGLPILLFGVSTARGSMMESWEAQPPTEVEETDCRIESMMGGDNPVEVERVYRACVAAANEAFVRPRARRTNLFLAVLVLAYVGVAGVVTARYRSGGGASA